MERYWEIGRRNRPGLWESCGVYPRSQGPFIRAATDSKERELVIGQWGLIPWYEDTSRPAYTTNNARFEGIANKSSFKVSWTKGYRCIIPALSFDEPCWETGKNVWWNFRRADGAPWGLAGLWNTWIDKKTGAILESYTMLTLNADGHPLMSRMHKPDPRLPADQQDKRSVVAIELRDVDTWLRGPIGEAIELVRVPPVEVFEAGPIGG